MDGTGVTFADLESASSVLLVCFEPEEEAGVLFLRLRKAFRKQSLPIATVAPFLSTGAYKMGARLIATVPGGRGGRSGRAVRRATRRRFGDPGRRAGGRLLRHADAPACGWRSRPGRGLPGCPGAPGTVARSRPAAYPTCCRVAARWPIRPPASTWPRPGGRFAAVAARTGRRRDPDLGQRRRTGGAGRRRRRPERLPAIPKPPWRVWRRSTSSSAWKPGPRWSPSGPTWCCRCR